VLSRVLLGGLPVLLTSLLAALLGSAIGILVGLGAALFGARRRWAEGALLRPFDALAALPRSSCCCWRSRRCPAARESCWRSRSRARRYPPG
jgi:hypothetical protein